LKINSIVEKSAAEKSGLQKGDFLISLDGEKLDSREELTILISLKKPNDLISLEYLRDRAELSVQLALGTRPQN
jgi:S1-C subfamily serine protease